MIENGYQSAMDLIFSNGWDISSSLMWVVRKRDIEVVKVILDRGACVDAVGHVRMRNGIGCTNNLMLSH